MHAVQRPQAALKSPEGDFLKPEVQGEPEEGPLYTRTLTEILQELEDGRAHAHPFKTLIQPPFDIKQQKPLTRRLQHMFSVEESVKIKAAGAPTDSMPEKLTVNHLAHAAVSLLPIFDNPPSEDSNNVVFYHGLVDARKRLSIKYRGNQDYPGYCLGMSAIKIPVSLYHRFSSADRKTLVLEFAKEIRQSYKKQSEYQCLLAVAGEEVEKMLQGPPPPPWCGPWYAGDGHGSIYLAPEYSVNGNVVIEVNDFFLRLNKCDPGPFFRAYEWKERIILSADFNELAVKTDVVRGWMKLWADLLLAL